MNITKTLLARIRGRRQNATETYWSALEKLRTAKGKAAEAALEAVDQAADAAGIDPERVEAHLELLAKRHELGDVRRDLEAARGAARQAVADGVAADREARELELRARAMREETAKAKHTTAARVAELQAKAGEMRNVQIELAAAGEPTALAAQQAADREATRENLEAELRVVERELVELGGATVDEEFEDRVAVRRGALAARRADVARQIAEVRS